MRSILSELLRKDRLRMVEDIGVSSPRTRELVTKLKQLQLDDVLIVVDEGDFNLECASRNLHWAAVITARSLNPLILLNFEHVLMTAAACRQIERRVA